VKTSGALRAGIIGGGAIARQGHIPALLKSGTEIVAICDPAPGRAAAVAKEFGITGVFTDHAELLAVPDIDVIFIGTPNVFHAPIAIAALEAGKHVLCEKPIAVSSVEAESMIAASKRADRLLSVNQHMRFHPTSLAMRDAVADGSLGEIFFTDVRWMRSAGIPGYGSWFTRKELAGAGALFDIGVHMLDLGMFILGFPEVERAVGEVSGRLGKLGVGLGGWGTDRGDGGFDVDDTAIATLALAGGGTLRLHVAWASFCREEERVTVQGTLGGADRSAGLYGKGTPLQFFAANGDSAIVATPFKHAGDGGQWFEGITSFLRAVRGEGELVVKPEETLHVLRVMEAIVESSAQGHELVL
jgi:predicted dehydrogenase